MCTKFKRVGSLKPNTEVVLFGKRFRVIAHLIIGFEETLLSEIGTNRTRLISSNSYVKIVIK